MKTYSAEVLGAVVLVALMLTAGCVPQEKYDELLARNKNAQDQLDTLMASLEAARAKQKALQLQIDQLGAGGQAKDEEVRLLKEARADLQKRIADLEAKIKELKGTPQPPDFPGPLPPAMNQKLVDLVEKYPGVMEFDAKRGMVKLKSDLTFEPGSTDVKAQARQALSKLAEVMRSPEAANFSLYVVGHTDDIRIAKPATLKRHPTNWYLSVHRAVKVLQLLESDKIAPARMAAAGFGEYQPIAPNAPNKKGNPLNRRVEIYVVPTARLLGGRAGDGS